MTQRTPLGWSCYNSEDELDFVRANSTRLCRVDPCALARSLQLLGNPCSPLALWWTGSSHLCTQWKLGTILEKLLHSMLKSNSTSTFSDSPPFSRSPWEFSKDALTAMGTVWRPFAVHHSTQRQAALVNLITSLSVCSLMLERVLGWEVTLAKFLLPPFVAVDVA